MKSLSFQIIEKKDISDLKLSNYDSSVLTAEKDVSDYFDLVLELNSELKNSSKIVANWITSELFSRLKKKEVGILESPITPNYLGELVLLIIGGKISGKIAKDVFDEMFDSKKSPHLIIKEKNLIQVTNYEEIEKIIDKILDNNKDKVSDYKLGKIKLLGFFVGESMKLSKGKVNPKILNELLLKKLS